MAESQRLRFLVARDGPDAAGEWARDTMRIYRQVLLAKRSHTLYRRPLVESCCALRRFVVGLGTGTPVEGVLEELEAWEAAAGSRDR